MIQGSEEWKAARCGKITASRIADLTARTKSGYGASRKNYLADLLVERLTGEPVEGYTNTAMQWGVDHEAEARTVYEFETGNTVEEVGFIEHNNLSYSGASPDGLVNWDGMVEIKCPNTATHIETLLSGEVPERYYKQMQWQMECCGRLWCDYVSYDPRMKDSDLILYIKRIPRDQKFIDEATHEVMDAEKELQEMVMQIKEKVGSKK
jgi:putative phage-type endonuclease